MLYLLYMCLPGATHMMLVLRLGKTSLKHKITPRSRQHIITRHGSVQKNRKKLSCLLRTEDTLFRAQQAVTISMAKV